MILGNPVLPSSLDAHPPCVIGLDLGTGGVRALIVTAKGDVLARSSVSIDTVADRSDGHHEQDPQTWWTATRAAIHQVLKEYRQGGGQNARIRALSVDGTSGTVVGLDLNGAPCTRAMMYNDSRAWEQAQALNDWSGGKGTFNASWSLSKMLWLEQNEPDSFAKTHVFAHQADFINSQLTGVAGWTDASNALKSGFDLQSQSWPPWLASKSGIHSKLPKVRASGTPLATLSLDRANELGLPHDLQVIAGATDGTTAFLASGATQLGDDNVTLGTTLVFKRLAPEDCIDPAGLVYSHRLPDQLNSQGKQEPRWLPGAASNVGAEWITQQHPSGDLARLDAQAAAHLPCKLLAYPLARQGERFPFAAPDARGFLDGPHDDEAVSFAARLQGVALTERLGFQVFDTLRPTPHTGSPVYATGGGSRSDIWMQLRADVTQRTYHRPRHPESAFGSAILAAANTIHSCLWDALGNMIQRSHSFDPNPVHKSAFDDLYGRFIQTLEERGYLQSQ